LQHNHSAYEIEIKNREECEKSDKERQIADTRCAAIETGIF